MKRFLLIVTVIILSKSVLYSRELNDTLIEKTGWLVFWHGQVVWLESDLNKNAKEVYFFQSKNDYINGLIVNYISIAKYYKSIAKCYYVDLLMFDSVLKRESYSFLDSICILPVKVKFKATSKPVSELLTPMGLSFKKDDSEVTLKYNFETNYDISEIQLLRKRDKRRIKRVKDYLVGPTN